MAMIAVAVLLASVVSLASPADAGFPPGEGTGSISGTVVGPGGVPLEGVFVTGGSAFSFAQTMTDADGTYVLDGLVAGYYGVAFNAPPGSGLAGEYYDDSPFSPTPVRVFDEQITPDIDAELEPGGAVSGVVTDPQGDPVEGVEIEVGSWSVFGFSTFGSSAETDADGTYVADGLPPGYYRIQAFPPTGSGLTPQYYDGQYLFDLADPVFVPATTEVADVDFQLEPGAELSGTVTDQGGAPLAGVIVSAQGDDFGSFAETTTAANGTWTLDGLLPGDYRLRFDPSSATPGVLGEWYDNSPTFAGATVISLDSGEVMGGIVTDLSPAASLSGTVTGLDGLPDRDVVVFATTPAGQPVAQAITTFNGEYSMVGLPAGNYLVEFRQPFNTQYFDGVYRRAEATPVTLIGGQETENIDAVFEAIVLGSQLPSNTTTVEAYCFDDDPLTFTFDVANLDTAGGVTGGMVDFGDASPSWAFDAAGDTIEHTFPTNSTTTLNSYDVTLTLTGGSGASDEIVIPAGNTDCREATQTQVFPDVPPTHPFYEQIQWLAGEGITQGFSDGTFRPGINITRQAVAAWLYAFAGEPTVTGPQEFPDVPPAHPFYDAIQWMAQEGITQGFSDGTFRPGIDITRQAVAAWLYEFDQTL
jgi:protocatechuate 3,4-dioxygenase beta subunit